MVAIRPGMKVSILSPPDTRRDKVIARSSDDFTFVY
jgi:hypothetical protein